MHCKTSPLWPLLLLPLFYLLNAANTYFGDLDGHFFLRMGLYVLMLALVAFIASRFVFRDPVRSFLLSLLLTTFFYFAKNFYVMVQGHLSRLVYFLLIIIFFLLAVLLLRKAGLAVLGNLRSTARLILVALVLMEAGLLAYRAVTGYNKPALSFRHPPQLGNWAGKTKPNIYLLLFDEYQGNLGMKALFGHDNSPFTRYLRSNGFTVVEEPRSNYNYTYFSVPSMFAMDLLTFGDGHFDLNYPRVIKAINTLNRGNHFTNYLQQSGYRVKNFSLFALAGQRSPYTFDGLDEDVYSVLYSRTLPGWLRTDLFNTLPGTRLHILTGDLYAQFFQYNISVRRDSHRAVREPGNGPVFVYAHFLLPHFPALTDSTGKARELGAVARELHKDEPGLKNSYLEYTLYANKVCREITDGIILQDPEAVILVLSDHGLRRSLGGRWVHDIQMAIRSPEPVAVYKGMTTVNLLRLTLNAVAGQHLALLPDSSVSVK